MGRVSQTQAGRIQPLAPHARVLLPMVKGCSGLQHHMALEASRLPHPLPHTSTHVWCRSQTPDPPLCVSLGSKRRRHARFFANTTFILPPQKQQQQQQQLCQELYTDFCGCCFLPRAARRRLSTGASSQQRFLGVSKAQSPAAASQLPCGSASGRSSYMFSQQPGRSCKTHSKSPTSLC